MNKIAEALKWGASALRVAKVRVVAGNWLKIGSGKPMYLGKGARVILGEGATLVLEGGVYMNEGCRVSVVQSALIGANTLFGPNVQIYDHDHEFDCRGVSSKLTYAPVSIDQHCCLCANAVVKRGSSIACRSLVSDNSVVTYDLTESGALYACAPARLI